MDDVDLYRGPSALLELERRYLRKRLVKEKAEVERFEEMPELLRQAKLDVARTTSLISEYTSAIRLIVKAKKP